MAERTEIAELSTLQRQRQSHWSRWADGAVWRLTKGGDFTSVESCRQSGSRYARLNGLKFSCHMEGDCVLIQFTKRTEPA